MPLCFCPFAQQDTNNKKDGKYVIDIITRPAHSKASIMKSIHAAGLAGKLLQLII